MATQAWQMPDVDAEKYQSVTKQGGARSEITQQSGLSELKWDNSPMTISEVAECECWLWKGCEWVISTPLT